MNSMKYNVTETEVLIIGAGIAGCRAAIEATTGVRMLR